jgi:hypothetical protein
MMGKAVEITRLERLAAELRSLAVKIEDADVVRRLLGIALLLDVAARRGGESQWDGPADAVRLGASLQRR